MDVHQNKISEIPNKTGQTINVPIFGNATFRRIGKPLPALNFCMMIIGYQRNNCIKNE
jgi:hypothetical protein